jgi:hypothetical protein
MCCVLIGVVGYLSTLPLWERSDLTQRRGVGEKYLLRQAAASLGLKAAAALPKRAAQFGSHIVKRDKATNKGQKGQHAAKIAPA